MNRVILFLLLVSFTICYAQKDSKRGDRHFSKKFEELQKIKLIETLNLDEETTLKFFARRNTHNNNIAEIRKEGGKIVSEMENLLGNDRNEEKYEKLLQSLINNEKKIVSERSTFINSLNDILTKEQIVKMVLYERRFREDVKDLLIERGRKRFLHDKPK